MEIRRPLLGLLAAHEPFDAEESGMSTRLRDFVEQHSECFERSFLPGHVTASAWITDALRQKVLLTHHRKLAKWLQLGGHADGDPDAERVARREVSEESGLDQLRRLGRGIYDVDVHPIPPTSTEPAHFHYDIRFAFEADADLPLRLNEESKELRWIELKWIQELTIEPSILRMVAKMARIE